MSKVPTHPKIFHITHVRNLSRILQSKLLWSDAQRIEQKLDCEVIGMREIKQRRLERIEVTCHRGTHVGDYVPFYLCPRSIMLYILHRGNHPDLNYREGQAPIIHLQADLNAVANWADQNGRRWAFTNGNAGALYVEFFNTLEQLAEVNWTAVESMDFRNTAIKEGKQAEFLVHGSFPWKLVERIGVKHVGIAHAVEKLLAGASYQPPVSVENSWYY